MRAAAATTLLLLIGCSSADTPLQPREIATDALAMSQGLRDSLLAMEAIDALPFGSPRDEAALVLVEWLQEHFVGSARAYDAGRSARIDCPEDEPACHLIGGQIRRLYLTVESSTEGVLAISWDGAVDTGTLRLAVSGIVEMGTDNRTAFAEYQLTTCLRPGASGDWVDCTEGSGELERFTPGPEAEVDAVYRDGDWAATLDLPRAVFVSLPYAGDALVTYGSGPTPLQDHLRFSPEGIRISRQRAGEELDAFAFDYDEAHGLVGR